MYLSKTDRIHPWTGIFIDIFPLDRLPESAEERQRFFKKVHSAAANLMCMTYPNFASGSRKLYANAVNLGLPRFIAYHGQAKKRAEIVDQVMETYRRRGSLHGLYRFRYRLKEYFPRKIFSSMKMLCLKTLKPEKLKMSMLI